MAEKTKIIFMGTADFAVPIVKKLNENSGFLVSGVITKADKPVGRKQEIVYSPVKKFALENNLPVFQPEKLKDANFLEQLKKIQPDLIIVCAYGKIIPKEILDLPKIACINVHPSLLPRYRGASPIQSAILNCEKITGTTIMLMDEGMDTGDILSQKEAQISDTDNFETMHDKLADLSADLLIETLEKYLNKEIVPQKQDDSKATLCKILEREDGQIDWSKTVEQIDCQIRAFTPWPGAFTFIKDKRIKILEHKKSNERINPGEIIIIGEKIIFGAKDGAIEVIKLQLEGKKAMTAGEFLRGNRKLIAEGL